MVGTAVLIAAGLFLAGLALGLTMVDFVLTVVVPAAPILTWAVRESFRQRDAAEEAETIKAAAEALWAASVGSADMGALDRRAREFQDAIHARRKARPLPVPFVYDLLRPSMEKEMCAGAAGLLGQLGIVVPSPGGKERAST